jgi:hypothetical protein
VLAWIFFALPLRGFVDRETLSIIKHAGKHLSKRMHFRRENVVAKVSAVSEIPGRGKGLENRRDDSVCPQ